MLDLGGVPIKVYTDDIDGQSIAQLGAVSRLPIVAGHVAAMPDVHLGIGATVGAVIPTRHALIPAAVGVDIGCGMTAVRLNQTRCTGPGSVRINRVDVQPPGRCVASPSSRRAQLSSTARGTTLSVLN